MILPRQARDKHRESTQKKDRFVAVTVAHMEAISNVRKRDISNVRVILALFGIFAIDMTDIDAMGIHDPEGYSRHIGDWRSNGGSV